MPIKSILQNRKLIIVVVVLIALLVIYLILNTWQQAKFGTLPYPEFKVSKDDSQRSTVTAFLKDINLTNAQQEKRLLPVYQIKSYLIDSSTFVSSLGLTQLNSNQYLSTYQSADKNIYGELNNSNNTLTIVSNKNDISLVDTGTVKNIGSNEDLVNLAKKVVSKLQLVDNADDLYYSPDRTGTDVLKVKVYYEFNQSVVFYQGEQPAMILFTVYKSGHIARMVLNLVSFDVISESSYPVFSLKQSIDSLVSKDSAFDIRFESTLKYEGGQSGTDLENLALTDYSTAYFFENSLNSQYLQPIYLIKAKGTISSADQHTQVQLEILIPAVQSSLLE